MSKPPSLSQQHYDHHQAFEITPDYYLHVHSKSLTQQGYSHFDLFDLDLHPSRLVTSSRPLLFATLVFILITLIEVLFSFFKGVEHSLEVLVISSSLALLCGLLFYASRKTMIIYHHRQTHQALFEVLVLNKSKPQRDVFIKRLNSLLLRLSEHDRSSFYAQQAGNQPNKNGLSYN
jgi:hypothetical protein